MSNILKIQIFVAMTLSWVSVKMSELMIEASVALKLCLLTHKRYQRRLTHTTLILSTQLKVHQVMYYNYHFYSSQMVIGKRKSCMMNYEYCYVSMLGLNPTLDPFEVQQIEKGDLWPADANNLFLEKMTGATEHFINK